MKTVIVCEMTEDGIDKALEEIEAYKRELNRKANLLVKRVGEFIRDLAETGFATASPEDIIKGPDQGPPEVTVSIKSTESMTVVIAEGQDAVFIEFGAGVYHNGPAGSTTHPWGAQNGFLIGEYGQGKGSQTSWGFYDENGELVVTRGTPQSRPLYKAVQAAKDQIADIAREVFG